jgi:hypothetical protein
VRRALAVLGLALALAGGAAAEAVRSEGVGTAPLPGAPGAPPPRQAALEAALANAALRVAESLAGQPKDPAGAAALREALGPNPGRFAVGYRSVSEIERSRAEAAGREVAVTVEAQIDRPRVEAALRRAGLLAEQAAPPPPDAALRIVVEPLPSWPALAALRRRLVELGARSVQLERVEPERAVLALEGGRSAASLVAAVAASPPPGVSVMAEGERDGIPRIRLEGAPAAPGPIDTPAAKR